MYIELHCASAFSFLQGASLPETLVERAAALGYPALALLDADGVYGAPRFHKAAQRAGLKAIIGAELTIETTQDSGLQATESRITEKTRITGGSVVVTCSGGNPGRLSESVPVDHAHEDACGSPDRSRPGRERRGGVESARVRWRSRSWTGPRPASSRSAGGRCSIPATMASAACSIVWSACSGGAMCLVELQRHLLRDEEAANAALTRWRRPTACP